ncbi:MAG: Flp pilus assembly complex ATPase component TadA [Candidatus Hydrogenedentes bacterium]|nr:Flp pilus assembly complex ATPase component TadA [Candidatus Hydrogenedentota bacterium]
MNARRNSATLGENLVKQELITRDELNKAKEKEASTGTPWYKQLIQARKVSFNAVEDMLRYEFHSKAVHTVQQSMGDTLVGMGVLTQDKLEEALALQKRKGRLLGNILVEHGYATREDIARAFSLQHELPYTILEKTPSDTEALALIPESVARKNEIIPISLQGDRLDVLITSPQALDRLEAASIILGKRIHVSITACEDIKTELARRYGTLKENDASAATPPVRAARQAAKQLDEEVPVKSVHPSISKSVMENDTVNVNEEVEVERESARFEAIARAASGSSVIQMVTTIIEGAVNSGATDIHLDPQEPEMRVRYRIDGVLHDIMSIPEELENAVVSRIKIIAELDITDTRHPQDGHISLEVGDREFDVRVATLPTFLGERIVLRLLDQSSVLSGIRDLGLESDDEESLTRIIEQPYGMILVTGPTGSGKTTTLYAALNQKNVMTDSIVTIEDPVEYQLSGINQVQIDTDIDVTFANTLRAALRQDIDVLLVGEIRDSETARIAIRAAMTGHLVFSTLHTNDAPEAIATLRNMEVPAYLISSALTAVIGQRLVRTICRECVTSFKPAPTLLKSLGLPATTKKLFRGSGCDACYHTGNHGRTGIFEVLEITEPIRKLIYEEASAEVIMKAAKLTTMAMRCRQKVTEGLVNPEEFLRVIRT